MVNQFAFSRLVYGWVWRNQQPGNNKWKCCHFAHSKRLVKESHFNPFLWLKCISGLLKGLISVLNDMLLL